MVNAWVLHRTDPVRFTAQAPTLINPRAPQAKEHTMSLGSILLIILILMLIGALPSWPHSQSWGYGPSGGLGLVVVVVLIFVLMGRL